MAKVNLEDVRTEARDILSHLRDAEDSLQKAWNLIAYDTEEGKLVEHPIDLPNPATRSLGYGVEMAREEISKADMALRDVVAGREGDEPQYGYPGLG